MTQICNVVPEYCAKNARKMPHPTLCDLLNLVHRYKWNHTIEPCHYPAAHLDVKPLYILKQIVTASKSMDPWHSLSEFMSDFRDSEWSTSRPFLMDTDDRGTCTSNFTNRLRESLLHYLKEPDGSSWFTNLKPSVILCWILIYMLMFHAEWLEISCQKFSALRSEQQMIT